MRKLLNGCVNENEGADKVNREVWLVLTRMQFDLRIVQFPMPKWQNRTAAAGTRRKWIWMTMTTSVRRQGIVTSTPVILALWAVGVSLYRLVPDMHRSLVIPRDMLFPQVSLDMLPDRPHIMDRTENPGLLSTLEIRHLQQRLAGQRQGELMCNHQDISPGQHLPSRRQYLPRMEIPEGT